ncbi:something about silencing protein 10 [Rhinatrema bivittatum]|uniref:something about silencing protein 10 n=1 Tax=Rhinatrema bivittatum TaxID=194408 RepID=UPI0011261E9C|nr:something about silencing protein 10 [Rhinatrema bivittatum]
MGKPRRAQRQKGQTGEREEDVDDDIGPQEALSSSKETSSKYFNDEVDDFHEEKFKNLMARGVEFESEEENLDSEDEVLALDVPDEEDEEQSSMESDLEEHADDGIPNELAWGQKKQLYYDTDYESEKKKSKKSQEEVDAEAEEEEQEAQNIQKRLLGNLNEEDYGLDFIQAFAEKQSEEKQTEQKIVKDLKKMSDKEKLKLLKKESPELLELIQDLRVKLTELKDQLEPLIQRVKEGSIPQGKGSNYIQMKYQLYLNYCTNISYYLVLKAKRIPVHGHPVIERLVTYRNLINDLDIVDQRLSSEIHMLLVKGYDNGESTKKQPISVSRNPVDQLKSNSKSLQKRPSSHVMDMSPADDSELEEEADALKYYHKMEEMLRMKRKKGADKTSMEEEPAVEGEDPSAKRAITYQIAKNKGLTPKRKKIDRNPRVKHREKFRRAKIRRKGQVREVRKEDSRYAGELSGIRAGLKKSIKLK